MTNDVFETIDFVIEQEFCRIFKAKAARLRLRQQQQQQKGIFYHNSFSLLFSEMIKTHFFSSFLFLFLSSRTHFFTFGGILSNYLTRTTNRFFFFG